jgi:hypothetical protein
MGAVLGVLLRNYGFTDLPPSLPVPLSRSFASRSDPVTRISESKRRRQCTAQWRGDQYTSHVSRETITHNSMSSTHYWLITKYNLLRLISIDWFL